jgi:hypothetical protein
VSIHPPITNALLRKTCEGRFEIAIGSGIHNNELQAQRARCRLQPPSFVTQPLRERLAPEAKLFFPIRPRVPHGLPLQKPITLELLKADSGIPAMLRFHGEPAAIDLGGDEGTRIWAIYRDSALRMDPA